MQKPRVLIVEIDGYLTDALRNISGQGEFEIRTVSGKSAVVSSIQSWGVDVVLLGVNADGIDGLEMAAVVRQHDKAVPLVLVNQFSSEQRAIRVLRIKVDDYLRLPLSSEVLIGSLHGVLCGPDSFGENIGRSLADRVSPSVFMIGRSALMCRLKAYLRQVATVDCNLLVTGETGTGKERAVELVHSNGPRRRQPLVRINCAALPDSLLESELFGFEKGAFTGAISSHKGKMEQADGGTILFDEIGEMSAFAQAKILRVIEDKNVYSLGGKRAKPLDVCIVAATNQSLESLVANKKFRQDLFFRLNVVRIHIPPLRERKDDIPLLAEHFMGRLNHRFQRRIQGFTDDASRLLLTYDWPGNVRELKNVLESIYVDPPSDWISPDHLPDCIRTWDPGQNAPPAMERDRVLATLLSTRWNKSEAARKLNWSCMTLYRKMAKYEINISSRPKELRPRMSSVESTGKS